MNSRKPSTWVIASVVLIIAGGLVLLPGATPRLALAQPPLEPEAPPAINAITDSSTPTSITKDADGHTVWTYEYPSSWCVMYSRIRWPFNLGTQDPSDLSETTITLSFGEEPYVLDEDGNPRYTDPTWAVALNGDPGPWTDGAFTGEWNIIGAVGTTPTWPYAVPVEQEVSFDYTELIDGENNLWFQQQDFCNCTDMEDCACTCYELTKLKLRAYVDLSIKGKSPAPDTRNVWPDQGKKAQDSDIRVTFTTLVSPTTVNKETFQVYYLDKDVNKIFADGDVKRLSDTEYVFVPNTKLLPGVKYFAQVWGANDAHAYNRDKWVQDLNGGPLEDGDIWSFWTLPDLEVTIKPVQVLENMALIVNKPTVLRTYIRWDAPEDVFWKHVAPNVEIEDLSIVWVSTGGDDTGAQYWRNTSGNWLPEYNATTAKHKREYREFTREEESYDNWDRWFSKDSINFFGFTPVDNGSYQLTARVLVKDSRGRSHPFIGRTSADTVSTSPFNLYFKAMAVGADYGKTGTVDLSTPIYRSLRGVKAVYPVSAVTFDAPASATPYYTPTTSLWLFDWKTEPGRGWPKEYLLEELSRLCLRTTGCRAMVGFAPTGWMADDGLTLPEDAPRGALVKNDVSPASWLVMAHEIGHLARFEHIAEPSGEGYYVARRQNRQYSIYHDVFDFMDEDPIQAANKNLWISNWHYISLGLWSGAWRTQTTMATTSADSLLLVAGAITPTTGETTLLPWYQMDAGTWTAPDPGPYQVTFLDASDQEILGYTRSFSVSGELQPAGSAPLLVEGPAPFAFLTPYPAATAKVQIQRITDTAVLAEVIPAANPPTVTIQPPPAVWTGPQALTWDATPGATYFAMDVSTDNGTTWKALALDLITPTYTLQTIALPNTTEAFIRVAATNGLRTTTAISGPFTIDNPPLVSYVDPPDGATDVGVNTPMEAGFRDAMAPASIHTGTFTLTGDPWGTVLGSVTYDTATHAAILTPIVPLAYATRYTATLTTGIQGEDSEPLPITHTWTFTTELDTAPPTPVVVSPQEGAMAVPCDAVLAVSWDRAVNAGTLTTETFVLTTTSGTPVSGTAAYDAATRTATFTPATALLTDTLYIATLKAGIASTGGYTTTGDFAWAFTTGRTPGGTLALTGSYTDWGQDTDGDGLYEHLVIRVGVQVTETGDYVLSGSLVYTDGGEIAWTYITPALTAGVHFLDLAFDGTAIGGHNTDGPFVLTDLTLTRTDGTTEVPPSTSQHDAYRTFTYPIDRFPAPLRFGGLPDVLLIPGITTLNAFNVHDYMQHITRTSEQISYTVMLNTNPQMDVALQSSGAVVLTPETYWQGNTLVTIRASDGVYAVQDTFEAAVGWPYTVYLPLVLRNYGGASVAAARDAWITKFTDDFESDTISWSRYSWTYKEGDPPPGGFGSYKWDINECRAYAGQQSAWAYGGGDDGELLSCGASYPDTYSLGTEMYQAMPINLKYVAKGEYSAKVWTNLAPDDELCLKVAVIESGYCFDSWPVGDYYGVCRTGATNGWEDLTLDMANVPTLGNVLGQEHVCVQVGFEADTGDSRPEGAYVDDVSLRICPEGVTDNCAGSAGVAPLTTTPLVAGNIGGYPEAVDEVALAVDDAGHVYALWTGKLNPAFDDYVFYSSSANGVNWTPYQILSYWGGREPQIAVDNVHGRVHLAYANDDGIVHRIVEDGVISAPEIVAPRRTYYLPDFNLPSGGVAWPSLAVAEQTGDAYLIWREAYYARVYDEQFGVTYPLRYKTWHATGNEERGWSAPLRKINDEDTFYSTIVAAPDGQAMLAWFQQWEQSLGDATTAGDPIVARTAYGTEPGSFPLRQATHDLYILPQRDESIVLAYSGGDDSFVLASDHFMWPGHSLVYRYVWKDGAWSGPLDVAENTSGWGVPTYVGAAADTSLIRYIYNDNYVLTMRTETTGVLGPEQTVASYLTARGYTMTGSPLAYFTDAAGGLHMVISGEKNSVAGFYYVQP
ncbi:MAG: Ig-like domain-containing protein [Anaerolineae bacterium]